MKKSQNNLTDSEILRQKAEEQLTSPNASRQKSKLPNKWMNLNNGTMYYLTGKK
jgi:hypothetical protein